jgi:D-3-phosphoglycerate dehydrogenase
MKTCLVVQPIHPDGIARLEAAGITTCYASSSDMKVVVAEISGADAVITRDAGLSASAIAAAPRLQVIANHGIGTNKIDVAAATKSGIPIVFTPHANARSVAEHTITLMLAVARRIVEADRATKAGDWNFRYSGGMQEMSGKTLGLIGFGTIAREVCEIARDGFGMNVRVWSPHAPEQSINDAQATRAGSLQKLLGLADVISMHRPLREDTHHTLDAAGIELLKPNAIVINTARGGLIDEAALADCLRNGRIAGAGLDVFANEPMTPEQALAKCDRTVLGPHVAGSTDDALRKTALQCAEQIIQVLAGKHPDHLLDMDVWERRRIIANP